MATCAQIIGARLPDIAGEDSVSLLPEFLGAAQRPAREATLHQSASGDLAIRQGPWKLIFPRNGSREFYNLADDLSETDDVAQAHPHIVQRLIELMRRHVAQGRSTAGAAQRNESLISFGDSSAPPRNAKKTKKQATQK